MKGVRIKLVLGIIAALVVTHFAFNKISSPQELVASVNNMIYQNKLTNKVFANNTQYQNLFKFLLVGNTQAAEDKIYYYKGKRFKIRTRDNQIPDTLLEYMYQHNLGVVH